MARPLRIDEVMPLVAATLRADFLRRPVLLGAHHVSGLATIREIVSPSWPENPAWKVDLVAAVVAEVDRLDASPVRPFGPDGTS